ncbi:hypothetical protein HAZT_HAZT000915 [Hyalella azteca]|uniref:EGF-like domain-containing protein n=1 Tax=Hyalella azteca TaxID=294128 RepID=A0A6A0H6W7_HYAAZ|nr:hypothetical protein HAZT_HAZT000915 [Hyalella azteca]
MFWINGGTCVNTDGGYRCTCPPSWYGSHCTLKEDTCTTGSASTLCDHGDCYPQPSEGRSYTCRCHQGWTKAPGSNTCSQDVDECAVGRTNHCSANPAVMCINLPGSYTCAPCPAVGDPCMQMIRVIPQQHLTVQIREAIAAARVLLGTRATATRAHCGPGRACSAPATTSPPAATLCSVRNVVSGVRHMLPDYYQCTCPPGYAGNGIGPFGCSLISGGGATDPCANNPCVHGTCLANGNAFVCHCSPGYTGEG